LFEGDRAKIFQTVPATLMSLDPQLLKSFSKKSLAQIKQHAADFPQEEVCGIVVNGQAIALPNAGRLLKDSTGEYIRDKVNNFAIAPSDLAKYDRASIQSIYHSHWSDFHPGELTIEDLEIAHSGDRFPLLLYHSGFDSWDYYEPDNPNPFPLNPIRKSVTDVDFYLNWRFTWGRSDCFALIRRFCLGTLGTDIGEWSRPEQSTFPLPDFHCTWKRKNLIEIDKDNPDIRLYDLIEIAMDGGLEPNHLAIVVDPVADKILHNPGIESRSYVGLYGNYWRGRTVRRQRLKQFV
jgi:proteasome lid subunit RPN8/RPN11